MTIPQERREELRDRMRRAVAAAEEDGAGAYIDPRDLRALLDAPTRAEAQSGTRRLDIEYWQERAERFQQDAKDERAGLLDALEQIKARDARIQAVERMRDTLHLNYTTMSGPAVAAALTRALEG